MGTAVTPVLPAPARRWSWLAAGVLAGLVVGFGVGLARPRVRRWC